MKEERKGIPETMEWEQRVSDLWASIDDHSEEEFLTRMEQLVAELPADSAVAVFERAASLDSTGHSDLGVPLYRQALELGLPGERRRRAVIQMASSLRNMGRASESVALLTVEREVQSDDLDDAVSAFLALALVDTGADAALRTSSLLCERSAYTHLGTTGAEDPHKRRPMECQLLRIPFRRTSNGR